MFNACFFQIYTTQQENGSKMKSESKKIQIAVTHCHFPPAAAAAAAGQRIHRGGLYLYRG